MTPRSMRSPPEGWSGSSSWCAAHWRPSSSAGGWTEPATAPGSVNCACWPTTTTDGRTGTSEGLAPSAARNRGAGRGDQERRERDGLRPDLGDGGGLEHRAPAQEAEGEQARAAAAVRADKLTVLVDGQAEAVRTDDGQAGADEVAE